MAKFTPETCPLFLDLAPSMIEELEAAGIVVFSRVEPIEHELWAFLKSRARFARMGRRLSMVRFGGWLARSKESVGLWSVDLFETTLVSLELDFLTGRAFTEKFAAKTGKHDSLEGGGSTAPIGIQLEDRSIRCCCKNACVVKVMTWEETQHRRMVLHMFDNSEPFQ